MGEDIEADVLRGAEDAIYGNLMFYFKETEIQSRVYLLKPRSQENLRDSVYNGYTIIFSKDTSKVSRMFTEDNSTGCRSNLF